MHLNFMHALMAIVAGVVARSVLRRSKRNQSNTFSLLLAAAGCLVTLFVESCEPWNRESILAVMLCGLVPMLPFVVLMLAARLAITSKMQTAVSAVSAIVFVSNVALYCWAYFIERDEYASLGVLILFPVNLLIALWVIMSLLWEPRQYSETTT